MTERNYFDEVLPEYRTPRLHAAVYYPGADKNVMECITQWVCTLTNSLDKRTWFHAVKVAYVGGENEGKTEVHFYTDERDALLYRAHRLNSKRVHLVLDVEHHRIGNEIRECGLLEELNFVGRSVWDGYTLQEIRNLKG